jgi:hypothetical protein
MIINPRGFWENETAEGHGHDEGLADALVDFFRNERAQDVLDLGCGDGYYVTKLRGSGIVCIGVDGNPYTANLLKSSCYIADLTEVQNFGMFNWVLSLEVGEHIPQEYEEVFLKNLDKHNVDGIVLSWAVRGQGGDGHVNCKDNVEVIPTVCSLGYDFEVVQTNQMRERCAKYPNIGWWFRNTLMIFRRKR